MNVDDNARLRHMLDYACQAVRFLGNKSRAEMDADEMLTAALFHCLEVVGEAASRMTRER